MKEFACVHTHLLSESNLGDNRCSKGAILLSSVNRFLPSFLHLCSDLGEVSCNRYEHHACTAHGTWKNSKPLSKCRYSTPNSMRLEGQTVLDYHAAWGSIGPTFKDQAVQEEAWPLKTRPIGSPETSVSDHLTPRDNPEDGRIQFNSGGKTDLRNKHDMAITSTLRALARKLWSTELLRRQSRDNRRSPAVFRAVCRQASQSAGGGAHRLPATVLLWQRSQGRYNRLKS